MRLPHENLDAKLCLQLWTQQQHQWLRWHHGWHKQCRCSDHKGAMNGRIVSGTASSVKLSARSNMWIHCGSFQAVGRYDHLVRGRLNISSKTFCDFSQSSNKFSK